MYGYERSLPSSPYTTLPQQGNYGSIPGIPGFPGGAGFPGGGGPQGGGQPGTGMGQSGGLNSSTLMNTLGQYPKPVGSPPTEMVALYNQLKANPSMLQMVIQQRPNSMQQVTQLLQGFSLSREQDYRPLAPMCYNRWSLVFTFTDVFLMWPVVNFLGFVIGYCFWTPCMVPDFQILFCI
jgi:hypothetical protein